MVPAHSRALKTTGNTAVIQADLRDPAAILNHPRTLELVDFSQPLTGLLVAVLHFIDDDDDPHAIVGSISEAMPPGSYLVVSHARQSHSASTGAHYEIDLISDHAQELREQLGRYVKAARKVTGSAGRPARVRRASGNDARNKEIRNWAKAKGLDVNERGRIPADIVARYEAETGK